MRIWRDGTVRIGGGGGSGQAVLRFSGTSYSSNPAVPPALVLGEAQQPGIVLTAQDAMRKIGAD